MSGDAIRKTDTARSSTVVPLLRRSASTTDTTDAADRLLEQMFKHLQFNEVLRRRVESVIMEQTLRERVAQFVSVDSPFGPVYIASLKPDLLAGTDIRQIEKHKSIVDLSDSISFNDGWDD